MQTEHDLWSRIAVMVSVTAIFVWALATTINIGDAWVLWTAVGVAVIALGSVAVRGGLRARNIVWTEELREEQRRRYKQMLLEMIPTSVLVFGNFVVFTLGRVNVLPHWLGLVLLIGLLVAWIWLNHLVRRRRV